MGEEEKAAQSERRERIQYQYQSVAGAVVEEDTERILRTAGKIRQQVVHGIIVGIEGHRLGQDIAHDGKAIHGQCRDHAVVTLDGHCPILHPEFPQLLLLLMLLSRLPMMGTSGGSSRSVLIIIVLGMVTFHRRTSSRISIGGLQ